MREVKSFKKFISSNWWFLLLGFSKVLVNSEKSQITNFKIIDFLILVGFFIHPNVYILDYKI